MGYSTKEENTHDEIGVRMGGRGGGRFVLRRAGQTKKRKHLFKVSKYNKTSSISRLKGNNNKKTRFWVCRFVFSVAKKRFEDEYVQSDSNVIAEGSAQSNRNTDKDRNRQRNVRAQARVNYYSCSHGSPRKAGI